MTRPVGAVQVFRGCLTRGIGHRRPLPACQASQTMHRIDDKPLTNAADCILAYGGTTEEFVMTLSTTAYLATSLDGFIARTDGALDWLDPVASTGQGYGYDDFIASVDVLLMGGNTFRKVLTFQEWPYANLRVLVASSNLKPTDLPEALRSRVAVSAASPQGLWADLAAEGARHVYVDGGRLVSAFLRAGLLDRLILNRVPVLLGGGIPLFGALDSDIALQHQTTQSYASGLVQSTYLIHRAAQP